MEQQNKKEHLLNYPLTEEQYNKFLEEVKDGDLIHSFNSPFEGSSLTWVWLDAFDRPQKIKEDGTIE